jgi:hypothetical protein
MTLSDFMKRKVSEWLKEEGFFYEEIIDPDTRFNFSTKVAGLAFDIVQDLSREVVVVRSTLIFNDEQMGMVGSMSAKRKEDFLWDIRFMLLGNNEISGFRIKPDLERIEVLVQSGGIFQDAFTKDRFIHSILIVHKAITMVIWMLSRSSGKRESVGESNLYM